MDFLTCDLFARFVQKSAQMFILANFSSKILSFYRKKDNVLRLKGRKAEMKKIKRLEQKILAQSFHVFGCKMGFLLQQGKKKIKKIRGVTHFKYHVGTEWRQVLMPAI